MKRKHEETTANIPVKRKRHEKVIESDKKLKANSEFSKKKKGDSSFVKQKVSVKSGKPQNVTSAGKSGNKSSKKWKNWNKVKKKKKEKKTDGQSSEVATENKPESKRVQIPREISNNWKSLHEVLIKDQKEKKVSSTPHNNSVKRHIHKETKKKKDIVNSSDKKNPEVLDIWFDGVDEMLLDIEARKAKRLAEASETGKSSINPLVKVGASDGVTKIVAMDCEMVGVGVDGGDSMLARVSIVNKFGHCIYDKYVKPMENVVDYRTFVSGITPENIKDGEEFFTVQKEVSKIIKGKILVGHAITNDLKVLYLQHDKKNIRDTSKYKGYRSLFGFKTPSLKKLTKEVLGIDIQDGEHDSVQDAQAAMRLYTMYRKQWEKDIKIQRKRQRIRKLKENSKT